MKKKLPFRAWFYFRQGWTTYFAFILAAINTLTVTYYLAIDNLPLLKDFFPTFGIYLAAAGIIGVPLLIFVGYIHYKRSAAYEAEADINVEAYPYFYKLPPGWNVELLFPLYSMMMTLLVKLNNNEKLTEEDRKAITDIQTKIDHLLKGGYLGHPKFGQDKKSDK